MPAIDGGLDLTIFIEIANHDIGPADIETPTRWNAIDRLDASLDAGK